MYAAASERFTASEQTAVERGGEVAEEEEEESEVSDGQSAACPKSALFAVGVRR